MDSGVEWKPCIDWLRRPHEIHTYRRDLCGIRWKVTSLTQGGASGVLQSSARRNGLACNCFNKTSMGKAMDAVLVTQHPSDHQRSKREIQMAAPIVHKKIVYRAARGKYFGFAPAHRKARGLGRWCICMARLSDGFQFARADVAMPVFRCIPVNKDRTYH